MENFEVGKIKTICVIYFMEQNNKKIEEKEFIYINTSIVLATIGTILPLIGIFVLSNSFWGIMGKISLLIIILSMLRNYFFHPMWEKAMGFGAGVFLNMIWFGLAWFYLPDFVGYIFMGLFVIGLGTMKYTLKQYYEEAK